MPFCPQEHISEMLSQFLGDRNVHTHWPSVKVNRCASRVLFASFDAGSGKFSLVKLCFGVLMRVESFVTHIGNDQVLSCLHVSQMIRSSY